MLGFNTDLGSVKSDRLHKAYSAWRAEPLKGAWNVVQKVPSFRGWCMIASVDMYTKRVRYESIGRRIKETGFDFVGKRLDDINLPTGDFFGSAYRSITEWMEPVFGWHQGSISSPSDFEFVLLPIGSLAKRRLYVLGLEDWLEPDSVPLDFRAERLRPRPRLQKTD